MSIPNGSKKETDMRRPTKSFLDSLSKGKRLRLREDVYKQFKDREWVFSRIENDMIFLTHESEAYGMAVRIEDIDWSDF